MLRDKPCDEVPGRRPFAITRRRVEMADLAEQNGLEVPETSAEVPVAMRRTASSSCSSLPLRISVRSLSAFGITLKVTRSMTASVPKEPASSLQRS